MSETRVIHKHHCNIKLMKKKTITDVNVTSDHLYFVYRTYLFGKRYWQVFRIGRPFIYIIRIDHIVFLSR